LKWIQAYPVDPEFFQKTQRILNQWSEVAKEDIEKCIDNLSQQILKMGDYQKFFIYTIEIAYQQAISKGERQLQCIDCLDYSLID
jgi:hypothetical protein